MRSMTPVAAALLALAGTPAMAECAPEFAIASEAVTIVPTGEFGRQSIRESIPVLIRNDGDSDCTVRLGVSRDLASVDPGFPDYRLSGPNGSLDIQPFATAAGDAGREQAAPLVIRAGGETRAPFDVTLEIGWGATAGRYIERLNFMLFDSTTGAEIDTQIVTLDLTIPAASQIRFVGNVDRLDLGELSRDRPTVSPPFGVRIFSTSGYRLEVASQHGGRLMRRTGDAYIPYQMTLADRLLNLAGAGDAIEFDDPTDSMGDVLPIVVTVMPNPAYLAGNYSDRVTLTVTPF